MAVPSSGTLSLLGLAREKVHDNYSSGSSISGQIPLKFVTLGGQGGSQQETYDATNTGSVSNPDNVTPYGMSEFYGYDHDAVGSTTSYRTAANQKFIVVCSYSTSAAIYTVGYFANSSTVYTDVGRTTILAAGNYAWHSSSNSATPTHRFTVDGSGVISNWAVC